MAQKAKRPADEVGTLDEIESLGERASEWLSNNARTVLVVAMGLVVIAGAYGGWDTLRSGREEDASNAFEEVRQAYMTAMGAPPGALEVPELANPETARAVREEYGGRFQELAEAHEGTVAGSLARLEEASILQAAGDDAGRLAALEALLEDLPREPRLRGLVLQRIAQAHEDAESWTQAAEAHAMAGELSGYPLRHWAMADAARCFLEAGDRDRSVALLATLKAEAPDLPLPDHVQTRLQEIPAASAE